MFPSRRLLTILPRRTFTTTTLPRLSLTISHTHTHTHASPSRPSPLVHNHPSPKCSHQTRQLSSEPSETQGKKIPKYIQPGDWLCGRCQAHNFRTRMLCFECQSPNSEGRVFYIQGSWNCPTCNLYVPQQTDQCKRCMTKKEKEYEFPLKETDIKLPSDHRRLLDHKKGDWVCQSCGQSNKARSVVCEGCQGDRKITPAEELLGDWQCKDCKAVNYAHRKRCVMCSVSKPREKWDDTPRGINETMNTGP